MARAVLLFIVLFAASGLSRAGDPSLNDTAAPRGQLKSPKARKGAADAPSRKTPPRDAPWEGPAVEVRFAAPLEAKQARNLRTQSRKRGADPLYQAALACAEKAAAPVSAASCRRVKWAGCMYWCCAEPGGGEACEVVWCEADASSSSKVD